MSLAQQGHSVTLFEAYPHPLSITKKNSPKAYVIALGKRGQEGLESATGITPEQVENGIISTNFVRQTVKRPVMVQRPVPSLSAPRKVLAAFILDQASKAGVTIHYQHKLVEIDFDKRQVTLQQQQQQSSKEVKESYDLLIGADGANSQVRTLLNDGVDDFNVLRTLGDTMEYQVAILPASPLADQYPKDTVYSWNNKEYNAICLSFPLATGEQIFVPVFPQGKFDEFKAAGQAGFDAPLKALLSRVNDDTRQALAEQFVTGQAANGGNCVWTDSLGSVRAGVALVGDSGHAMWPSLGQGANCALESVAVFCQACRDIVGSKKASASAHTTPKLVASAIVQEFNAKRHADATAAVDLTFGGIGARTSRGRQNAPLSYKLQVMGMMLLNKITLGIVPKPALLRLMGGDCTSYATLHKFNFRYEPAMCVSALALLCVPFVVRWMKRP